MSNKCKKCSYISIGKTNKYIFLILIEALFCRLSGIIEEKSRFFGIEKLKPIIYDISVSLGYSLSFILLFFFII